jgi:hypothetical protein
MLVLPVAVQAENRSFLICGNRGSHDHPSYTAEALDSGGCSRQTEIVGMGRTGKQT